LPTWSAAAWVRRCWASATALRGISDGAAGLIGALEQRFPASLRQRCLVHRARNILAKVSVHDQAEVKPTSGRSSTSVRPNPAMRRSPWRSGGLAAFAARWKARYPSAVACVTGDLASLTVHVRFPTEHWRRIRHSNFIERTFGVTRRRVKVIGRLPGERSCLSLVWAVLDRASHGCVA
jgi:putative transposase